ncbi:MAG: hypothetical protein ACLFVU_11160 [Phycisphaerae bacterium]
MRWDADNAESMMALSALDHSQQSAAYWKLQRAACRAQRWQTRPKEGTQMKPQEHPRLIFGKDDVEALRQFAATQEGKAVLERLETAMEVEPDGISIGSFSAGHALKYTVSAEKAYADEARKVVERTMAGVRIFDSPPLWNAADFKMIYRTKAAVDVAIAYDLCYQAWDGEFRRKVAGELDKMARQFLKGGGKGLNRTPYSNWVGNTKAAAGFLALAVVGDEGATVAMPGTLVRAEKDFAAFLKSAYGPSGWCCEGFNYLRYPMTTSGYPFIHALSRAKGEPAFADTPAARFPSLYATLLVPGPEYPSVPFFGMAYGWFGRKVSSASMQYERTRWRSGDLPMLLALADNRLKPAVKWTYKACCGPDGDGTWDIYKPVDAVWALAALTQAADVKAACPAKAVGLTLADKRLGLYVARNGYRGADDCIAAIHLNLLPRRASYSFQDAGSFRILAFATRFADQASRTDRAWRRSDGPWLDRRAENVVQVPGSNPWPGGKLVDAAIQNDGGMIVTTDLSGAYSAGTSLSDAKPGDLKALRSFAVDYSGLCGAPMLVAVADRLTGGPRDKIWTMHTGGIPNIVDGGFLIKGAGGATLRATVAAPTGAKVTVRMGQETSMVQVAGEGEFLLVMTIQKADAPAATVEGVGLTARVRIGKRTVRFKNGKILLD